MGWPAVVWEWGSTAAERARSYPCDRVVPSGDAIFRAVSVAAPPALVFRWLCQLRVAPYSYDLIDNRGRRSPQTLTPGVEELAVGQRMMIFFKLVEFEPERSLTLFARGRLFGDVGVTYAIEPAGPDRSRLVLKFVVDYSPTGPQRHLMRRIVPPGDLVMARRQLLNLKRLAERDAAA